MEHEKDVATLVAALPHLPEWRLALAGYGLDVFALSSLEEGLPLALLEAMAMELPVVATAVGGVPELIAHADNGLLVPPRDPPALAAGIAKAKGDRSLARRARETVSAGFSEQAMLRAYDELRRSVCA